MKTKSGKEPKKKREGWVLSALKGAGAGLAVTIILLLLFCAILTATEDPGPLAVPLSLAALYLGGIVRRGIYPVRGTGRRGEALAQRIGGRIHGGMRLCRCRAARVASALACVRLSSVRRDDLSRAAASGRCARRDPRDEKTAEEAGEKIKMKKNQEI